MMITINIRVNLLNPRHPRSINQDKIEKYLMYCKFFRKLNLILPGQKQGCGSGGYPRS
jgi:hypothetical protein